MLKRKNHFKLDKLIYCVAIGTIVFSSCRKENSSFPRSENIASIKTNNSGPTNEELSLLKQYVANLMKVDTTKVNYDVPGKNFFIAVSEKVFLIMSLADTKSRYAESSLNTAQRFTTTKYKMTSANAGAITVYINPSSPLNWIVAVDRAINCWNASGSQINITRVADPGLAKLKIHLENWGPNGGWAGLSTPTIDGQCGNYIGFNAYGQESPNIDYITKYLVEYMGVSFGFMQTVFPDAFQIPGTLDDDSESVLGNSTIYRTQWKGFCPHDFIAIDYLYPKYPGMSRLLRYGGNEHFYTTNANEIGEGVFVGYKFEGSAGFIHNSQVSGTVPFHRFNLNGDHFYTTNFNEGNSVPGRVYEGLTGYVYIYPDTYPTLTSSLRPLYRYNNPLKGDHFYTTDINELGPQGSNDYIYEGIACYVR